MTRSPRRQRGATLIVSLIMLVLITLLAVSSFSLGKGNLQIVGNMQQRGQAFAAAQQAVATTISTIQFTQTPTAPIAAPCVAGTTNTVCVGVNADGANDITVVVTPICDSIQPISVIAAFGDPALQNCVIGYSPDTGVAGATNGNSMCSNSVWDVQANATDNLTGANFVLDQGVGVVVPNTTVCP